jgi:ATP-dependent exoDNAse (exonuclease V) beta subunit
VWYGFGYRYLILSDPRYHPYLEFYEHLLQLAEAADRRGEPLVRFLDFLRENLGRHERLEELEETRPRGEGVQLLTIHKSKGLQFPVVVLADAGNSGRAGGTARAYFRSDDFGIAVNLGQDSYFARLGAQESDELELAEIRRLLYVACTRAQSHLVLSGCAGRRARREPRAHLTMILEALGLEEPLEGTAAVEQRDGYRFELASIPDLLRSQRAAPVTPGPALPPAAAAPWYAGEPLERPAPRREISVTELCTRLLEEPPGRSLKAAVGSGPERDTGERLPALPVDPRLGAAGLEAAFGTLTHEILAAVLPRPDSPPPEPEWGRLHVPEALRGVFLDSARSLVSGFLDSELGARVSEAEQVETEVPFVYRWQRKDRWLNVSGQIDAVLHSAEGLTLIDFKTDRVYREGEHALQLGLYALALRELTGREVRATLFLLRAARAVPLTLEFEWELLLDALRL